MKTNITLFNKNEKQTYWNLVGASRHGEKFAGNVGYRMFGQWKELELVQLDDWTKGWLETNGLQLKADEQIFRYETDATRAGGISPLVKVNVRRGLVYFLNGEGTGFTGRGTKLNYLNLVA